MSLLMRKLYSRLHEGTDGEGSDLGGAPEPVVDAASEADAGAVGEQGETAPEAGAEPTEQPAGDEPKTMLEAIEKGLKQGAKEDKPAEQLPAKAEADKAKPEAKPEDLTQMPEGLSAKAQQRFSHLVTALKEKDTQYQQLQQEHEQGVAFQQQYAAIVRDIGASPDQLNAAAMYLKAANSGDLETRYNLLVGELRDVSLRMGKPLDGMIEAADPLAQFPDLQQAVMGYQMTRESALEMARYRTTEAQQQQQLQAQQQAEQSQQAMVQQWVTEKNTSLAAIASETKRLAAADPLYARIEAQIMRDTNGLKTIIEKTPPSTWMSQFGVIYSQVRQAIAAQAPGGGEPRPLSGGGGKPSGSVAAPKSMYDAMFGGR